VLGRWPDVAPSTPNTDVVVCHHVVCNVGDLAPFLAALDDHAERRVAVELTEHHPQSELSPCGGTSTASTGRPDQTATDAAEVAITLDYASMWSGSSGHRSGTMLLVTSGSPSPGAGCAWVPSTMPRSAPISTRLLISAANSSSYGGTPPPDPNK
jgi:hypothetical protein